MQISKLGSCLLVAVVVSGLLSACGRGGGREPLNTALESDNPAPEVQVEEGSGTGYEVLAEKLEVPWAIDFSGDVIYMTERGGKIVKVAGGTQTRQSVRLSKPVKAIGEGGLLGLALASDFVTTKQAYIYHTYEEDGQLYNRIALIREADDGREWSEARELLGGIPGASNHDGGRLAPVRTGCSTRRQEMR